MEPIYAYLQLTPALHLPVTFIFWGFITVYVVHILEESLLGEIFVRKMQRNFWPDYTWTHFAGFNTLLISLNLLAVILYEILGGNWIIFPLGLAVERCLNGFWHLGETILTRKFSSGLLTSLPSWILAYFIIRYAIVPGEITILQSAVALLVITAAMMGSMFHFRHKNLALIQTHSQHQQRP